MQSTCLSDFPGRQVQGVCKETGWGGGNGEGMDGAGGSWVMSPDSEGMADAQGEARG